MTKDKYKKIFFSKSLVHYCTILLFTFFTHFIIILIDGVFWDDWVLYFNFSNSNWPALKAFDSELGGLPVGYYLLFLIGHLPHSLFTFKLFTFFSICMSGCIIYNLSTRVNFLTNKDCLLISLLFIGYPAFQLSFMLSTCTYWIWYSVFLAGCFLSIWSTSHKHLIKALLILLSLLLFSISFRVGSLIVIYFGFLIFLFNTKNGRIQNLNIELMLRNIIIKYYYIIYPFIYFYIVKKYFPSSGVYKTYNKISLFNLNNVLYSFIFFLKNAIIDQFLRSIHYSATNWFIWILLIFYGILIYKFIYSRKDYHDRKNKEFIIPISFGLCLLFLSIFPYAVVNKYPHDTGVETRHSILIGLPMAIVLTSIIKKLFKQANVIKDILVISILISFSLISIKNYLTWQAHWVKDIATIQHLKVLDPKDYSIFWVKDDIIINNTEPWHQYYAYAGMFKYAWGGNSRIGLDIRDKDFYSKWILEEGNIYFKIKRYNLYNLDIYGKQALIHIKKGLYPESIGQIKLSILYWYYKYFNSKRLKYFLLEIINVNIQMIKSSISGRNSIVHE